MNTFLIPLEPLEERYTASWYMNIPLAFKEVYSNVVVIDGQPLSDYVDVGTFLDLNSSAYYKSEQLKQISSLFYNRTVQNGDIFFVFDVQFPGIETIKLLSSLQGIKVSIFGFCHASSYTFEDFMEPAAPFLKYFELGWLAAFDLIFVGTEYHKRAIIERRITPLVVNETEKRKLSEKIVVTGNPLFPSDYAVFDNQLPKKKQLIISNRFDWEKRPNLSLDFCYILKRRVPDLNIVVTTSRPNFKSNKSWLVELARCLEKDGIIQIYAGLTKKEYHTLLAESKIFLTNTIEENFGYCLVESILSNTLPIAENKYSHPELLKNDSRFLFDDTDEIVSKALSLLDMECDITSLAKWYFGSMDRIINAITQYTEGDGYRCDPYKM
jgi:glycosyltransferase involved in cell wall biosynthesis